MSSVKSAIYLQCPSLWKPPAVDPATAIFCSGCLLPDVNSFSNQVIDRRVTHFVGRLDEDGEASFTKSCANFLDRLNDLLKRPWDALTDADRAFVTGYLCHLAADETWKAWSAELRRVLNIASFDELSAPPNVILTAFSVLSHTLYQDFTTVYASLSDRAIAFIQFSHFLSHKQGQKSSKWGTKRKFPTYLCSKWGK